MYNASSLPLAEWREHPWFKWRAYRFAFQYGQPDEVYKEFARAMGFDPSLRDPSELVVQ